MRDFIYQLMTDYTNQIIFLHVLSAIIWVGGMMAILVITKTAHKTVTEERRLIGRAQLIRSYFRFLSPFIFLSLVTAIIMALGFRDNALDEQGFILDLQANDVYKSITMKGSLWIAMVMNMFLMVWIIKRAETNGCSVRKATDCMYLVNTYLLPLNIIMGLTAVYIGVAIRHAI